MTTQPLSAEERAQISRRAAAAGRAPLAAAAREAEVAKGKPDDPVDLCERLFPDEHERRVRAKVAEEVDGEVARMRAALEEIKRRTIQRDLWHVAHNALTQTTSRKTKEGE